MMLCILVSVFQTITSILFMSLSVTFFFLHVLCFLLAISLFKIASKYSIEMLSSVPKCKKATMCLMEKIYVKLHTGMI